MGDTEMDNAGITIDGNHQGDISLEDLARDAIEHSSKEPLGILVVEAIEMKPTRKYARRKSSIRDD